MISVFFMLLAVFDVLTAVGELLKSIVVILVCKDHVDVMP